MDRIFFNNIQKEAIEDEIKSFIKYELDWKDEKEIIEHTMEGLSELY